MTINWEQLKKGEAFVEIRNPSTAQQNLKISISEFGFKEQSGKRLNNSAVIRLEQASAGLEQSPPKLVTDSLVLPPAEIARLRIALLDPKLALVPGKYNAVLIVRDDPLAAVVFRSIQVQVESPKAEKLQPLVSELSLNYYRWIPFLPSPVSWLGGGTLPLKPGVNDNNAELDKGQVLGGLQRELGGAAVVLSDGIFAPDGSSSELKLRFRDLSLAGRYKGKIDLSANPVTLTVNSKDLVVWPALFMGIGIMLALRVKRYLGSRRTILDLRAQEAALGEKFKENQTRFAEESQNHAYASYSIAEDLKAKRKKLVDALDELQKKTYMTLDANDQGYKTVLEAHASLASGIDKWGGFAGKLRDLENAIRSAEHAANALSTNPDCVPQDESPSFLNSDGALLEGGPITLQELSARIEEVGKAAEFAPLWTSLAEETARGWERFDQLNKLASHMNDGQKGQLQTAAKNLRDAGFFLWKASTNDDLINLDVRTKIYEAENQLAELSSTLVVPVEPDELLSAASFGVNASARSRAHSAAGTFEARSDMRRVPEDDAARRQFYENAISKWDRGLAWLAFIIAVVTGLNQFYLNKPFGTIQDYVNVLLWGFGLKAALDVMNGAIERFFKRSG
ncbi:MAG: hypothetical protein AABN33_06165 [Acidobacteriota bacterium]